MSRKGNKSNALKHGANATEVLLWSEKYEDYEALRVGLNLEYCPDGSSEEYFVNNLRDFLWLESVLSAMSDLCFRSALTRVLFE